MGELSRLPNIGRSIEIRLNSANVTTTRELSDLGSRDAFVRLRMDDPSVCYSMLCALEGAIRGIRWHDLPAAVKADLRRFYDSL